MAKNYYITIEVHDEGEWPRIAPKDLMQHVDVRLPSGLTLASAKVSETNPAGQPYRCLTCSKPLATDEVDRCTYCADQLHDPDHLNPAEGGNRAGDDYWSER